MDVRGICEYVQARLPLIVGGDYPQRRGLLVLRHVARCADCSAELDRQRKVAEGLRELEAATAPAPSEPPDDLLDAILERVHEPGLRARVAGPARGAVSGARPELSVAAVLVTAVVVYLAYRLARALVDQVAAGDRR